MSTVDAFSTRPNQILSVECVRAALVENRIDLLTHWLSQDRYDSTLNRLLLALLLLLLLALVANFAYYGRRVKGATPPPQPVLDSILRFVQIR